MGILINTSLPLIGFEKMRWINIGVIFCKLSYVYLMKILAFIGYSLVSGTVLRVLFYLHNNSMEQELYYFFKLKMVIVDDPLKAKMG